MHVLIAEDDIVTARITAGLLRASGYTVTTVADGQAALEVLLGANPPDLALLDWVMPGVEGPDVCRAVRAAAHAAPTYLILLTAKTSLADTVIGLEAGADEYLVKPFNAAELRARVRSGARVVELQQSLAAHVARLEDTLASIKQLRGLIPICAYCKAIRDDSDYWQGLDTYLAAHSEVTLSVGLCPSCVAAEARGGR